MATIYAETTSTEVKLRLKRADFFVNYVTKTVRCGNFFLSATVGACLLRSLVKCIHKYVCTKNSSNYGSNLPLLQKCKIPVTY